MRRKLWIVLAGLVWIRAAADSCSKYFDECKLLPARRYPKTQQTIMMQADQSSHPYQASFSGLGEPMYFVCHSTPDAWHGRCCLLESGGCKVFEGIYVQYRLVVANRATITFTLLEPLHCWRQRWKSVP